MADSNDDGMITLSHVQAQVGTPITATLNDQDDISTLITWTWTVAGANLRRAPSNLRGRILPPSSRKPETGPLTVTAMYTDGGGND